MLQLSSFFPGQLNGSFTYLYMKRNKGKLETSHCTALSSHAKSNQIEMIAEGFPSKIYHERKNTSALKFV